MLPSGTCRQVETSSILAYFRLDTPISRKLGSDGDEGRGKYLGRLDR